MEVAKVKPSFIIKGALTYVLPRWAYSRKSGGTSSARYCYSVFLRHLVLLNQEVGFQTPRIVAELGPGDSIGMGLCALLCGAEEYIGLDLVAFSDLQKNEAVLDELVELLSNRTPIPDDNEFPRINPKLESYEFPEQVLTKEVLRRTLAPERMSRLKQDIRQSTGKMVRYAAPWWSSGQAETARADWIFSQAVLEHVDQLEDTYRAFSAWLRPGCVMSHQIDFKSHDSAFAWNGHWAAPEWLWRIVYGKRPYFLNRQPLSTHMKLLDHFGFETLKTIRVIRTDGLPQHKLRENYQALSSEDLQTAGAFIVSRRYQTDKISAVA